MQTNRLRALFLSIVVPAGVMVALPSRALSQQSYAMLSGDLDAQISNYLQQEAVLQQQLRLEQEYEAADEALLNRLKLHGSRFASQGNQVLARIRQERAVEAGDAHDIQALDSWVVYDKAIEQHQLAQQQYAKHNAEEDLIDQEVRRRNTYVPPTFSGSPLWGAPADGGYWGTGGYGGYGYHHGWGGHSYGHSYSSHGGGGGGHSYGFPSGGHFHR